MPIKANALPHRQPFDRLAARYDAWFDSRDGRPIFELEVACLGDLMAPGGGRWLEAGVGTGRFAQALGVEEGVDPSVPMLAFAAKRGIRTRRGRGEDLPYPDGSFDGVLMVVTICFLSEPESAMRECARVLTEGGHLMVGLVPSDSAWGRFYARRGRGGHPFYSVARFYSTQEVIRMADSAGFGIVRAASCLFSAPGERLDGLRREGIVAGAGFVAMDFLKGGPAAVRTA
jgi:ubiquinone/menaquinone biosynthesis C-methylase UbiE